MFSTLLFKSKLSLSALGGFILVLTLMAPTVSFAGDINASALIELTNQAREEVNLPPLSPNHKLTQVAFKKASDLLAGGYFSHMTPAGKPFYQWIEEEGYNYLYAGENLAIDFSTNEGAMAAWLASPTHRANILNENYKEIGIVALHGQWQGRPTTVVVQIFGSTVSSPVGSLAAPVNLKENLQAITANLILLPSFVGNKYFDIMVRVKEYTKLTVSNPTIASVSSSPINQIAPGSVYRTLLKTENSCCQIDSVFALTEEQDGTTISTAIKYPSLKLAMDFIKSKTTWQGLIPNYQSNFFLAFLLVLLLMLAYEEKLPGKQNCKTGVFS